MELFTKDLLINFLCILLPLFLVQLVYLLKYVNQLKNLKESWAIVFPIMSIFLCMMFPFSLGNGFTWDLRGIPFLLGVLYGGPAYGVGLLMFLLFTRFLLGGDGFYVTLYTYILSTAFTLFLSNYYLKMHLKKKLLTSGLLIFLSMAVMFFFSAQFEHVNLTNSMWLQYFTVNLAGMMITTAIWEVICTNFRVLERLMKAEKLEIVSNLAASISHEVRNPLTASKGFMQLSYEGDIPLETKQFIKMSVKELDRATEIINDYLTFAKPAFEGKEKMSVKKEIQNVASILMPLANMNNVEICLAAEKKDPCFITGERKKLEQALVNIVKNGIESMPDGGKLHIEVDYERELIRIYIRDQGRGMTQTQINRLGEPYFSTKENGTGLGMMVSFSIIQGIGGKIQVKSEIGKGTCFSIEFPVAKV